MMILGGAPSLSMFRRQKLLEKLQGHDAFITSVSAEYVHFIEFSESLSKGQTETLEALLSYGPSELKSDNKGKLFLVVPRPGTISPWSSKATDIAHNCGLNNVIRIEREIPYFVINLILSYSFAPKNIPIMVVSADAIPIIGKKTSISTLPPT